MLAFATAIGVDLRVFQRYLDSSHPKTRTIQKMLKALGYPPIVGRALEEGLTPSDIRNERSEIWNRCVHLHGGAIFIFGPTNTLQAHRQILQAMDACKETETLVSCVSILARHGLWFGEIDFSLGPYFSAIDQMLKIGGHSSLRSLISDAYGLETMLQGATTSIAGDLKLLGLTEYDKKRIWQILAPYTNGLESL